MTSSRKNSNAGALKPGEVRSHDLVDRDGNLLLRAGLEVTPAFIRSLEQRRILHIYAAGSQPAIVDNINDDAIDNRYNDDFKVDANDTATAPYDLQSVRKVKAAYHESVRALMEFSTSVLSGATPEIKPLESSARAFLDVALTDSGVVLASALDIPDSKSNADRRLADRCTRMSMLATVTAAKLEQSPEECVRAGLAGLLHDLSLFGSDHDIESVEYHEHPIRTIDLLRNNMDITDEIRVIIGQVHEQIDGSGFPRGLSANRIHRTSRILNVIDAYLSLLLPANGKPGFIPADAIMFLVRKSVEGYYDVSHIKALVAAASAYPVGTTVVLDDQSTATVLRCFDGAYTQPIVQLNQFPERIIDLRRSSRSIVGVTDNPEHQRRIPKSFFSESLSSLLAC